MIPGETTINGEPAPWTEEIRNLWINNVEPLFVQGTTCSRANYFTPRPYKDEYNRGSREHGFVYVVHPGNHVCFWERVDHDGTHP